MCVCVFSHSVVSTSLRPHGQARLFCPWNFSCKNTGVSCPSPPPGDRPNSGSNPRLLRWQEHPLPLGTWKAWAELHTTGWGAMLNRVTQQQEWDHPTTTCLGQSSFTPQLPLMGLDIWWREEWVLWPREKVGSSLATVTLGIQPRAKNKGPALLSYSSISPNVSPRNTVFIAFCLFIHSYILSLSLWPLLSYF